MATFSEISAALDKALSSVKTKKDALDKANATAVTATNEYNDSVQSAQALRQQLTDALAEVLPTQPTRVRVSA